MLKHKSRRAKVVEFREDDLSAPSMLPAASAAAALAQLGQQKVDSEWDSEGVCTKLPQSSPSSIFSLPMGSLLTDTSLGMAL